MRSLIFLGIVKEDIVHLFGCLQFPEELGIDYFSRFISDRTPKLAHIQSAIAFSLLPRLDFDPNTRISLI
ncbi:hypothetical protein [Argonema galeatum]|uniref:hypothetical protein n=1 Tax=Argonema galeatum TaxID=2942762 RepID=UPI0020118BE3|nr:hypothetical protein [Argonema galeatum]MCL1466005.1 hypothetical protein [Argonema galeatum A003/A1]